MALSRKHYVEVAAIIDSARNEWAYNRGAEAALQDVAVELASFFKRDNPSFDRARFLEAAGITDAFNGLEKK